jgi:hypothetical protein
MSTESVASPADQLLKRLDDPEVAEGLNQLLDRLDTLAFAVGSLEEFISRGEVIADSVADSVSGLKQQGDKSTLQWLQQAPELLETGGKLANAAREMDVDELANSHLLRRLTDPETLGTLNQLLDSLPLAAFLLESLEGFIRRGEVIADNLAEGAAQFRSTDESLGTDQIALLLQSLPRLREAGEKLLESELMGDGLNTVVEAGVQMVESGMLDREVVAVLGEIGKKSALAYQEVTSQPVQPVGGLFATLRAMKDPDVQKSTGLLFAFAKAFGKQLN